jgi:hypothetical protein
MLWADSLVQLRPRRGLLGQSLSFTQSVIGFQSDSKPLLGRRPQQRPCFGGKAVSGEFASVATGKPGKYWK